MIAARALQGVGAAILAPSTLALLTTSFDGEERTRAIALYCATAGASLGLVLGGVVTDWLSWRVGFFLNVPIGITMMIAAPRLLLGTERRTGRYDLAGALASMLGMTALVVGLVRSAEAGWGDPLTLATLSGGALMLTLATLSGGALMLTLFVLNESAGGAAGHAAGREPTIHATSPMTASPSIVIVACVVPMGTVAGRRALTPSVACVAPRWEQSRGRRALTPSPGRDRFSTAPATTALSGESAPEASPRARSSCRHTMPPTAPVTLGQRSRNGFGCGTLAAGGADHAEPSASARSLLTARVILARRHRRSERSWCATTDCFTTADRTAAASGPR